MSARTARPPRAPRPLPEWFKEPDFGEVEAAAERHTDFITVIAGLSATDRLSTFFVEKDDAASWAMALATGFAQAAVRMGEIWAGKTALRDRARTLATRIDVEIAKINELIDVFNPADDCDFERNMAVLMDWEETVPPESEGREHKFHFGQAEDRLARAETTLAEARDALCELRRPLDLHYEHDGRRHLVEFAFVRSMSDLWAVLTGEPAPKSGGSDFLDFVLATWTLVGWPIDDKVADRLDRQIATRW